MWFFTSNRPFYPSTSSTTSVRADYSILEDIQVMWSHSYATEMPGTTLPRTRYAVSSAVGNAMSSYQLDTTGTTYTFYETGKKEAIKNKTKTRKTNRKRKKQKRESKNQKKQLVKPPPAGEVANT